MKITTFLQNYYNYNSPKTQQNHISFGTTHRYYKTTDGDELGTNTWPFRDDIEWAKLAKYEKKHFKDKKKVNTIQFASSDGSEAYTKIISLIENNPAPDDGKFFPIKAFDIDPEVIKAAKSKLLNTMTFDRVSLQINTENYDKYFTETDKKLDIKDDIKFASIKTLKVSDILTDKVIFENNDMYKVLAKIRDESNTILMCRNILGYFDENKIEAFVKLVAQKLKTNSLFLIGEHDTRVSFIERYLGENGFAKVMKHVFKKI